MRRSTSGEVAWLSTRQDGFDPRTPCCRPGGEEAITRLSEGRGPGSIPGRGTAEAERPRGVPVARDPAKVEAEVRLLTRILSGDRANGEPPALGAGHNGVRFPDLRLTPAGVCRGGYGVVALHAAL